MHRALRNTLLAAGLAIASAPVAQADYGFFASGGSYVILQLNGGASTYYYLSPTGGGNPSFVSGFGTLWKGFETLVLKGFENNTFSNGGDDVISGSLYYRLFEQNATPGAWNVLGHNATPPILGAGNERHERTNASIDIFTSNLMIGSTYTLQVYPQATVDWGTNGGTDDTFWVNNSGNTLKDILAQNPHFFQANFTVAGVPEPSTGVLLGLSLGVLRLIRRKPAA